MIYQSSSSLRTKTFARDIARAILKKGRARRASIVALSGDLGAGKTTFVQGFARAIGARGRVSSPTFIILRRMKITKGPFKNLFHIDAYRIKNKKEISGLGILDIFSHPENIILIEWPERLGRTLTQQALRISFRHGRAEHERIIQTSKKLT